MEELKRIAEKARNYAENDQNRKFNLEGACHENVIGAADYIRWNTDYTPIIVWGVYYRYNHPQVDKIEDIDDRKTHFWLEVEELDGIIDIYAVGEIEGECYAGDLLENYHPVEKFYYYGDIDSFLLSSKDRFMKMRDIIDFV